MVLLKIEGEAAACGRRTVKSEIDQKPPSMRLIAEKFRGWMNLDPKNPNQRFKMSFKAIQEEFIQENRQNSLRTVRTEECQNYKTVGIALLSNVHIVRIHKKMFNPHSKTAFISESVTLRSIDG
jgi:hypothetical protein